MHAAFVTVFFFIGMSIPQFISGDPVIGNCSPNELVMYKVTLTAMWDKRDFPKQYPDRRPPAQWSKLIGVSHNHQMEIYEPGELATEALKEFAETGNSDQLDLLTQGGPGVLDAFRTAPIGRGVGEAHSHFFVDGNHSRVSLVSKIIPSPDWFIGVNGYDLCAGGHWVDTVNIQLEPLDAGTDKGLTFTSPNWLSDPPERIHTITAQYPDHPAGSFYYPTLDHLPPIARITFSKEKEYGLRMHYNAADVSLNDVFGFENISIKKHGEETQEKKQVPPYFTGRDSSSSSTKSKSSAASSNDISSKTRGRSPSWLPHQRHRSKHRSTPPPKIDVTEPGIHDMNNEILPNTWDESKNSIDTEVSYFLQEKKNVAKGNAMTVIDDIVKNYQKDMRRKMRKKRREEKQKRRLEMRKIRPPRDCRVSEWSEWSSCSKTCGIGEQTRQRKILKHARRGGKVCPSLKETTWCGSARDCNRSYFIWS